MNSHSTHYRRKNTSEFEYLLGFESENSRLIILGEEAFFVHQEMSSDEKIWDDEQLDHSLLQGINIIQSKDLKRTLFDLFKQADRLAFPIGKDLSFEQDLLGMIAYNRSHRKCSTPLSICDSRQLLGYLRLKKDDSEKQQMREASRLSSIVHNKIFEKELIGLSEKGLSNWIEEQMLHEGISWTAYETIVGSGSRSTYLHARATDKIIQKNEIVLIDAGGEYQHYCSDITRSIPAGRLFTKSQEKIYNAVLQAQKEAISSVQVGQSLQQIHEAAIQILTEELRRQFNISRKDFTASEVMPHSTSHWLGLDVHDPCPYFNDDASPLRLEEGMCFTIEPGVYIKPDCSVEELRHCSGVGIRIEDNILVTEKGYENLTDVPKELEEIYEMRKSVS